MKKLLSILLAMTLILSIALFAVSCGEDPVVPDDPPATPGDGGNSPAPFTASEAFTKLSNTVAAAPSGTFKVKVLADLDLKNGAQVMKMTYEIPADIAFDKVENGVNWSVTVTLPDELAAMLEAEFTTMSFYWIDNVLYAEGNGDLDAFPEEGREEFLNMYNQIIGLFAPIVTDLGALGDLYTVQENNGVYTMVAKNDIAEDLNAFLTAAMAFADVNVGDFLYENVFAGLVEKKEDIPGYVADLCLTVSVNEMLAYLDAALAPMTLEDIINMVVAELNKVSPDMAEELPDINAMIASIKQAYGECNLVEFIYYMTAGTPEDLPPMNENDIAHLKPTISAFVEDAMESTFGDVLIYAEYEYDESTGENLPIIHITYNDIVEYLGMVKFTACGDDSVIEVDANYCPVKGTHKVVLGVSVDLPADIAGPTAIKATVTVSLGFSWELDLTDVTVALPTPDAE